MNVRSALSLIFLLLFSSAVLAENGYVQARQAELFAAPSFKAAVVAVAHKGDALIVEQRQGRWLKVKFGDKVGWVSTLLVGGEPPKNKITVLDEGGESLDQSARRRASATAAAGAARGLRGEGQSSQNDGATVDSEALQRMEQENVSEEEALQFQQQEQEK